MEGIDNFIQRIESIPQDKESTPQQKPSPEVGWLDRNYRTSKELDAKDKDTDISLKKIYGWSIIGVLGVWELFVIGFCFIQVCCPNAKEISDAVFITLLTSATANILILPTIVLNYLFPKEKNSR